MCIDKLDIEYAQPTVGRLSTTPDIPDHSVEEVYALIEAAGFDAAMEQYSKNRQQRFRIVLRDDNYTAYFQLSGNMNTQHGLCLYKLEINPTKFSSLTEMWRLLANINPYFHQDVFNDGIIRRIDYVLDYQVPFSEFRQGVFYDPTQNLYLCANEDMSLREYNYDPVDFKSFRIGKNNRVFKFYDKGWKEYCDRNNHETPIRPKSRIELSLTGAATIARFWQRGYRARLSQLLDHLQDIITGNIKPFLPVTLYAVEHRTSLRKGYEFRKNQHNYLLRYKIQHGLLVSLWRECRIRMIDFWDYTRYGFALFRWEGAYQPTQAYAYRLKAWCYQQDTYDRHGIVLPDQHAADKRLTGGTLTARHVFIRPRIPIRL